MPSILGTFQAAQTAANRANLERYKEGISIYDEIITRYGKEGGFVKGQIAQLERRKTRGVAGGMQSLVSSGLAGTTMAAGLGKAWEEDVGTTARLSIADIAGQRLSQAQIGKAGFIERREDIGPDPSLVMAGMQGVGRASVSQRRPFNESEWGGIRRDTYSAPAAQPSISRAGRRAPSGPVPYTPYTPTAADIRGAAFRKTLGIRSSSSLTY